jgi:hypothetical protein
MFRKSGTRASFDRVEQNQRNRSDQRALASSSDEPTMPLIPQTRAIGGTMWVSAGGPVHPVAGQSPSDSVLIKINFALIVIRPAILTP